jgi:translation initiation factor IF-2
MVIGALLAGTVGGFMIPVRPEIRDVPALTASKATEPAKKSATDKTAATPAVAKTENASEIRKIPLTEAASKDAKQEAQTEPTRQADANSCAKETWPYRTPNCLDRSAKVAPADTVVSARRVDPTVSLQDKPESKAETKTVATPAPTQPKPETAATPKVEPAKSQQKVVSTPPARQPHADRPAETEAQPARAETQAAREAGEPRAERPTARSVAASTRRAAEPRGNDRQEASTNPPRRATRRANRNADYFDDGIPTRIYLRGPDGRLYLAPEYRPSGRSVYIMR